MPPTVKCAKCDHRVLSPGARCQECGSTETAYVADDGWITVLGLIIACILLTPVVLVGSCAIWL